MHSARRVIDVHVESSFLELNDFPMTRQALSRRYGLMDSARRVIDVHVEPQHSFIE